MSENKEEDKLLEQQYQQFIQKYMDDFVIWDWEAEWIKENMERVQKYNEYIDAHAKDIVNYVNECFSKDKKKMKQDILNKRSRGFFQEEWFMEQHIYQWGKKHQE